MNHQYTKFILFICCTFLLLLNTLGYASAPSIKIVQKAHDKTLLSLSAISTKGEEQPRKSIVQISKNIANYIVGVTSFSNLAEESVENIGSGIIWDAKKGLIVTSLHVVNSAQRIIVKLNNGVSIQAKLMAIAPADDIALLQTPPIRVPDAQYIGNSATLAPGETVIAIGNALGLQNTITVGVISGIGRSISIGEKIYSNMLQTDAAINPGNSGGALLNTQGYIIGMNSSIDRRGNGVAFAVPINTVRYVVDKLIHNSSAQNPWIGINIGRTPIKKQLLMQASNNHRGITVTNIAPDSPAKHAGLVTGDIITHINGFPINSTQEYLRYWQSLDADTPLWLSVIRNNYVLQMTVQPILVTSAEREIFQDYSF